MLLIFFISLQERDTTLTLKFSCYLYSPRFPPIVSLHDFLLNNHLLLPFQFQYLSPTGYIFCFMLKIHKSFLCWPFSWPLICLVLLVLALGVCDSKEQEQRAAFRERCFSRVLTSTVLFWVLHLVVIGPCGLSLESKSSQNLYFICLDNPSWQLSVSS